MSSWTPAPATPRGRSASRNSSKETRRRTRGSTSSSCADPARRSSRRSGTRGTPCTRCARTSPTYRSQTCRNEQSQSRKTTSPEGRAAARPKAASGTRDHGGSSTTRRPTRIPRTFDERRSLDGERFFGQPLRRGDELRHALLGIRQDGVAASVQGEPFLEDRERAVERQIAAGQRVHLVLEGREGLLERRSIVHGASFSWFTRT